MHLVINCQETTYRFNKGNSLLCGLWQVSIKHLFVSYDSRSCLNYLVMKIPVKGLFIVLLLAVPFQTFYETIFFPQFPLVDLATKKL